MRGGMGGQGGGMNMDDIFSQFGDIFGGGGGSPFDSFFGGGRGGSSQRKGSNLRIKLKLTLDEISIIIVQVSPKLNQTCECHECKCH